MPKRSSGPSRPSSRSETASPPASSEEPTPPFIPMLATSAGTAADLTDPGFAYEPKQDGIRAVVDVRGPQPSDVHLWSRLGVEKTAQFPEIGRALAALFREAQHPLWLDGEIIAVDEAGHPRGFQALLPRIHGRVALEHRGRTRAALVLFDLLRVGPHELRDLPFRERRAALERLWQARDPSGDDDGAVSLSVSVAGDGRGLWQEIAEAGGEGLVAKELASRYRAGERSPAWRKLKRRLHAELVVGGWTLPDGSRTGLKSLLVGQREEDGSLRYVGDVGSGFTERQLEDWGAVLPRLASPVCPFRERPPIKSGQSEQRWVTPRLVVEVEFSGWSEAGQMWHPVFLGLRHDEGSEQDASQKDASQKDASQKDASQRDATKPGAPALSSASDAEEVVDEGPEHREHVAPTATSKDRRREARTRLHVERPALADERAPGPEVDPGTADVLAQLEALRPRGSGRLQLPGGATFEVTNLEKVLWPNLGITKGDLLRYYTQVAPYILPVLADRPLIMKRFPNGIADHAFYQHRAPPHLPRGVVSATLPDDDVPSRLIGGNLATLLYMVQLASISMDPFFSRLNSLAVADFAAIDLDPADGVTFEEVLDVARRVHDELVKRKVPCFPKTSGSRGLHIFIPLPPKTPYKAGQLFCRIISTFVADKMPSIATVERTVNRRGRKIYLDYLQNIEGKTLAAAYSARASEYAGASTPLTWDEVHDGFSREAFTFRALPARLARVGDLWAKIHNHPGFDLMATLAG